MSKGYFWDEALTIFLKTFFFFIGFSCIQNWIVSKWIFQKNEAMSKGYFLDQALTNFFFKAFFFKKKLDFHFLQNWIFKKKKMYFLKFVFSKCEVSIFP